MEFLLVLALLALVVAFVTVPLRRRPSGEGPDPAGAERADLEARKEARYREIRDAEADHATGKLSDRDFERLDRDLRAEAIEILKRLDALDRLEGRERS